MKKLIFLLIFGISIANATFTSCSKEDDKEISDTRRKQLMYEYETVINDLGWLKKDLAKLQDDAKNATGGRWTILQEQISKKMGEIRKLEERKKQLERELGI
mgnify:CR=1 FL=1|jgi:hypothetical protein|nr:MAG TPA: protein of unknown function (DUF4972) [Caudoviricetes sp.]